jgi:hypothetical protein
MIEAFKLEYDCELDVYSPNHDYIFINMEFALTIESIYIKCHSYCEEEDKEVIQNKYAYEITFEGNYKIKVLIENREEFYNYIKTI